MHSGYVHAVLLLVLQVRIDNAQMWDPFALHMAQRSHYAPMMNTMPYDMTQNDCFTISRMPCQRSPRNQIPIRSQFPYANPYIPPQPMNGRMNNMAQSLISNALSSWMGLTMPNNPAASLLSYTLPFINYGLPMPENINNLPLNRNISSSDRPVQIPSNGLQNLFQQYIQNSGLGSYPTGMNPSTQTLSELGNKEYLQVSGCSFDAAKNTCSSSLNLCRGKCSNFGNEIVQDCRCVPDDLHAVYGWLKK